MNFVSLRSYYFSFEQNDKPSSVVNNHLSSSTVASRIKRPTRKQTGRLMLSIGLASDGVYINLVCYQTSGRLLHCLSTLTSITRSGIFLLHYPQSRLHRTLSGILPYEARTFLRSMHSRDYLSYSTLISQQKYKLIAINILIF